VAGDPVGWVFAGQNVHDVAFRATNGYIYEVWRTLTGIGNTNLSWPARPAAGNPSVYEFPAFGTHNGHIHRLFWGLGGVWHQDWTPASPNATSQVRRAVPHFPPAIRPPTGPASTTCTTSSTWGSAGIYTS
jgi:hypothetical protein